MVIENQEKTIASEQYLKKYLIQQLSNYAPVVTYNRYAAARTKYELQIVLVGGDDILDPRKYLPGTLMLAVAKHVGIPACNAMIKDKLEAANIIVSIGSACNTSKKEHSHVLRAMNMPDVVMCGAIRVSMCGFTTKEEIDRFVREFLREANRQYKEPAAR
jgi:cysteine desulfurase